MVYMKPYGRNCYNSLCDSGGRWDEELYGTAYASDTCSGSVDDEYMTAISLCDDEVDCDSMSFSGDDTCSHAVSGVRDQGTDSMSMSP